MTDDPNGGRRLASVRSCNVFESCDRSALDELTKHATWSTFGAGQTICFQGDECDHISVIVSGCVVLSFTSDSGREIIIAELGRGEILWDAEFILARRHLTNSLALEPTRLLVLRRAAVDRLLLDRSFSSTLLQAVCLRWYQLARFTEAVSLRTLEQRLAALLVDLCQSHGRPVRDGILIDRTISQTRMAQLINASRPRVNVRLRSWIKQAVIHLDREGIVVKDVQALKHIAAVAIDA